MKTPAAAKIIENSPEIKDLLQKSFLMVWEVEVIIPSWTLRIMTDGWELSLSSFS